jgi:hypothetical protein
VLNICRKNESIFHGNGGDYHITNPMGSVLMVGCMCPPSVEHLFLGSESTVESTEGNANLSTAIS